MKNKAQSISEYVLIFSLVIAAITGLNTYAKRGIQSTIKRFADIVSVQSDASLKTDTRTHGSSLTVSDVSVSSSTGYDVNPDGSETFSSSSTQQLPLGVNYTGQSETEK